MIVSVIGCILPSFQKIMHEISILASESVFIKHETLRVGDLVTAFAFGSMRTIKQYKVNIVYRIVLSDANSILAIPLGKDYSNERVTSACFDGFGQDIQFEIAKQVELDQYNAWLFQLIEQGQPAPANVLRNFSVQRKRV